MAERTGGDNALTLGTSQLLGVTSALTGCSGVGDRSHGFHSLRMLRDCICQEHYYFVFFLYFLNRFYLFIFRHTGREGEREGEKHQCVVASHTPPTATQSCPLAGNRTRSLLVYRQVLNPQSHTSQGYFLYFFIENF